MKPPEGIKALEYQNIATGEAQVDAQIGVVHGNLNIGKGSETPEEMAERGEKLLETGSSREAEQLLRDAINGGCTRSRAAYYWALSILSGRSWKQLEAIHLRNVATAYEIALKDGVSGWLKALRVVKGIVDLLPVVDGQPASQATTEKEVLAAYDRLDSERAAEIWRYLDQVLVGVMLEHVHQASADQAAAERLANGRAERVWKFFEPEPAPPERLPVPPAPGRLSAWLKLLAAAVTAGLACVPVLPTIMRGGLGSLGGVLLLIAGLGVVIVNGLQRRFLLDERDIDLQMFHPPVDDDGLPWKAEGQARFTKMMVQGAFSRYAPDDLEQSRLWKQMTHAYQLNLCRQFVEEYEAPEVLRRPTVLRWLARWHARQLRAKWDPEHPYKPYGNFKVPGRLYLGIAAGGVSVAMGSALLLSALWTYGGFVAYTILPLLIAIGVRTAGDQGCWLVSSRRATTKLNEASDLRYQREQVAYRQWCEVLADCPSDAEMARWLDHDKRYLRTQAMKLYQITHADLIAHVTYSAPTVKAREVWSVWGPKRYTEYIIGVLLMTEGGVRLAEFHLNMLDGKERDPERLSFRYDAVASVHVSTVHAESDQQLRKALKSAPDGKDDSSSARRRSMSRSGYRTIFRIVLLNREEPIEVFLDLFDDEIAETQEDIHELVARALDASGVAGALSMMEAITADGKKWLEEQETRKGRTRFQSQHQPPGGTDTKAAREGGADDPLLN